MTGENIKRPCRCPHCQRQAIFEEMPDGYASERWGGAREEVPYVRCPICTATFPLWAIEEYLMIGTGG